MEAKKIENLDPTEIYVARLEFRSDGTSNYVVPNIEYSHEFPDTYAGEWPYAYLAMRDIAMLLALQAQTHINTEFDLPDDPDELARVTLAQVAKDNDGKKVN